MVGKDFLCGKNICVKRVFLGVCIWKGEFWDRQVHDFSDILFLPLLHPQEPSLFYDIESCIETEITHCLFASLNFLILYEHSSCRNFLFSTLLILYSLELSETNWQTTIAIQLFPDSSSICPLFADKSHLISPPFMTFVLPRPPNSHLPLLHYR